MNPSGGNDRYISLLSQLGLIGRIITDETSPLDMQIDWNAVNERLHNLRQSSLTFLKNNL